MSKKVIFFSTLVLAVLAASSVRAQDIAPKQGVVEPGQLPAPSVGEKPAPESSLPKGLSNWITYTRPECCGPIGCNGPIGMELYMRTGPALPLGGGIFGHTLKTGWMVDGGGRSLFFNREMDAAWTIDLGVSNIHNQGQHADITVPIPTATTTTPATIRNLNRTTVNGAVGREWYLAGSADSCDQWRVGLDVGGRFGNATLEYHEFRHKVDVIGGTVLALHTDVETKCGGCCTFLFGFRIEWDYTWMDVFPAHLDADVQDINFLVTAGVRF
jgi:hypothetical protein